LTLSSEQEEYLSAIFDYLDDEAGKLTEWEDGFIRDQLVRYNTYKSEMRLSPKQWAIIYKIGDKFGLDRPDGDAG
jgi:hypothetical protein